MPTEEKRGRGRPRGTAPLSAQQKAFIYQLCAFNLNYEATCKARGITRQTASNWAGRQDFQEFLAQHQEIIGNCVNVTAAEILGRLVSHSRADIGEILPDVPIVQAAKKAGVSHWIKKVRQRTIKRANGETEEIIEVEIHDAGKALIQACKLMGLESRDDELERARTAIRVAMDLNQWSAEEAITRLSPHYPAVAKVKHEFLGNGPVIDGASGLLEPEGYAAGKTGTKAE